MSDLLVALKAAAVAAAKALSSAGELAQATADAYVQTREPVKLGDEVEIARTGRRFVVTRVFCKYFGALSRGDEPSAEFTGRRILKDGALGECRHLWDIGDGGNGCKIVGRYSPPEPQT